MKAKDLVPIARQICAELPGLVDKKKLIAATPVGGILRGFYFDDSAFDKFSFYIWAFIQPLFVPSTHLYFNMGRCLRGEEGDRWDLRRPNIIDEVLIAIKQEGLPFIQSATTPKDLALWTRSLRNQNDPYVAQARAYSFAAAHCDEEAMQELSQLSASLDVTIPWMVAMGERTREFANLIAKDPASATAKLRDWEKETKSALRIDDLV